MDDLQQARMERDDLAACLLALFDCEQPGFADECVLVIPESVITQIRSSIAAVRVRVEQEKARG